MIAQQLMTPNDKMIKFILSIFFMKVKKGTKIIYSTKVRKTGKQMTNFAKSIFPK